MNTSYLTTDTIECSILQEYQVFVIPDLPSPQEHYLWY